jgi:PAS domain S-box-containing protein
MNIRRNLWLLFICLLLYCFFPVSGHAKDAETKLQNITVVSDDNYPPYIFRNSNGVIQGILVDEWKLWEKKTGIKVNLIAMDWSKAQEYLLRGNADVIDTIFFTEERAKQYDFTKPYATIDVPVFFHKNLGGIVDIESLQGFTIGVKAGDACIEVLKKQGIISLKEYNSYETIVNAAMDGEIKVFSIDKPPALYYLYKMNFEKEFRYSFSLYTGEFHRAVKKGRTDILKLVEDGFALINRKEHDSIEKIWMGEPFVRPVYLRYVLFALLFAGVVFLVLLFINITLRRNVRSKTSELRDLVSQLRLSEERFRGLADSLPQIVFETDEKGTITFVNSNALDYFGYTESEFDKELNALQMICPEDRDRAAENIQKVLSGEILGGIEYTAIRKDGSTFPGEIHSKVFSRDNKPIGLRGIIVDLSKRKQAEEALRKSEEKLARSNKMESLGLLAGGVAHDLNNVLSGIVSYPELILIDLPEDSKLRKPIQTIQESGHRAAAIVQDLLTIARGVAITKDPLNLNELINDYSSSPEFINLKQFHPTVTVKTELDMELLNISGSHVHIRKVLMNLVSNAGEAIEGSGNVTISTVNRYVDRPLRGYDDVKIGEYVVLVVSDDGPGISSDDLERVFEPFYTKKIMGRSGTGLGLAVVWNVVQDHKGYIDVTSDENGTTFELYFPITREEISDKHLSIPIKDFQGNGETILVVDDVESQRDISCKMLDKLCYKAKAVSSGEEAVEYLKENTVDLLLLDMIMNPGINGRETYKRIIEIHPKQKAIIVSGFAETGDVKEAQRLGAGQYVKKPLTLEKIGMAVKKELEI